MNKYLTTLTGPSCAGKSTLEAMLVEIGCAKIISTTTRAPRAGEVNGESYHFVSPEQFNATKDAGGFIECVQFGEHQYGASVDALNAAYETSDHVILVCEPIGAKQVAAYCKKHYDIKLTQAFLTNPNAVIHERFLPSLADDIKWAHLNNQDADKVVKAAAKRLTMMRDVEAKWVDEALSPTDDFKYSLVIRRFDEQNAKACLKLICQETVART